MRRAWGLACLPRRFARKLWVSISLLSTWPRRGRSATAEASLHDLKEARPWLAETRSHVGAGSFVRPRKVAVEQWVTDWLPILPTQVRPQTFDSYARNLRLHLLPTLSRPLQSLKPAELSTLYARLLTSGRADHAAGAGLSHRSVAYLATIVGKCLEAAVRGDLLLSSPARRAEVPKASSTGRHHERMRTWTQQDLGRFLEVTREHPHHRAWLLLATTGLRRGEALGVAWSSVGLDDGRRPACPAGRTSPGEAHGWC